MLTQITEHGMMQENRQTDGEICLSFQASKTFWVGKSGVRGVFSWDGYGYSGVGCLSLAPRLIMIIKQYIGAICSLSITGCP